MLCLSIYLNVFLHWKSVLYFLRYANTNLSELKFFPHAFFLLASVPLLVLTHHRFKSQSEGHPVFNLTPKLSEKCFYVNLSNTL